MIFSERYSELIGKDDYGRLQDRICGDVSNRVKEKIAEILEHFAEPKVLHPNRYDSRCIKNVTALQLAAETFDDIKGMPYFNLENEIMASSRSEALRMAFTPFLFDVIELQYSNLSDGEKSDFQSDLNKLFKDNDIPWLLNDGQMIKIDSKQFEQDLKRKALEKLNILKDSAPVFQSAYDELLDAFSFYQKGNYAESIANAEKSYESIMKIICGVDRGNADDLTQKLINENLLALPDSINSIGFREKVLMALPFVRNNCASHGAGTRSGDINCSMANLALNLASALDIYLIDEYKKSF